MGSRRDHVRTAHSPSSPSDVLNRAAPPLRKHEHGIRAHCKGSSVRLSHFFVLVTPRHVVPKQEQKPRKFFSNVYSQFPKDSRLFPFFLDFKIRKSTDYILEMGVPGLWSSLEPAGTETSLLDLCLNKGFLAKPNRQLYRLGVDVSLWFYNTMPTHGTENHELQMVFFRMARLLRHPLQVLFVFDGPDRPRTKRGKTHLRNQHWLEQGTKQLAEAFGFPWVQAPGEAEAELAHLNNTGEIDAVLSEDIDTLIFGAKTVLRAAPHAPGEAQFDRVVVYDADIVRENQAVRLSHGGLILMALLMGGDYDPRGVPGCGKLLASSLARGGFGDKLLDIATTFPYSRRRRLDSWKKDVIAELKTNRSRHFNRANPAAARSLTNVAGGFPNTAVLTLYTNPITSKIRPLPPPIDWSTKAPDIGLIVTCCELYFQWGTEEGIIDRFKNLLFSGVALRTLIITNEGRQPDIPAPTLIRCLHLTRRGTPLDGLVEYRAEINDESIIPLVKDAIKGLRRSSPKAAPPASSSGVGQAKGTRGGQRVWLPGAIVDIVLPALVDQLRKRKKDAKAKRQAAAAKRAAERNRNPSGLTRIPTPASTDTEDWGEMASTEDDVIWVSSDDENGLGGVGIGEANAPRSRQAGFPAGAEVIDLTADSD